MPNPLVSIILTPWNTGAYLPRCLDSLTSQSFKDFETILVDNGSTDGALETITEKWPELNFYIQRLEENKGYTVANNLGARLARGKWLALLNTDAFPAFDWLENLLKATEKHPDFSFFASRQIQAREPQLLDGCGDALHISGQAWRRYYNYPAAQYGLESEETFSACGAAALYDRVAFQEVNGFDEDFFSYLEDIDLSFRLHLRGYRCLYVHDATVSHIGSASLGLFSDFAFYHAHRNIIWCFVKNMPSGLLWRYFPAHLAVNLIYLAYYTLRGRGKILWQAKFDALKGIRRTLQKRKTIQNNVLVSERDLVNLMERNWLDPYLIGHRARAIMRENSLGK
jgi:GT2 family glycosyltransferase